MNVKKIDLKTMYDVPENYDWLNLKKRLHKRFYQKKMKNKYKNMEEYKNENKM